MNKMQSVLGHHHLMPSTGSTFIIPYSLCSVNRRSVISIAVGSCAHRDLPFAQVFHGGQPFTGHGTSAVMTVARADSLMGSNLRSYCSYCADG
jgi:hypothetical protein